jgi:hypothetical protein
MRCDAENVDSRESIGEPNHAGIDGTFKVSVFMCITLNNTYQQHYHTVLQGLARRNNLAVTSPVHILERTNLNFVHYHVKDECK